MPVIDIVVESNVERSLRVQQLEAMFDVPPHKQSKLTWSGSLPIEELDWHVGLIVGPSGSGKSKILEHVFGIPKPLKWGKGAVIDAFECDSIGDATEVCSSVGFNTIPAWMRPFDVLSNGEKFRAELARRLMGSEPVIVLDEFTSVVDRNVAKIGAHAVQKYVRKHGKRFVAASCHYDIVDWLQPDWILEPATMKFVARGGLQRRPSVDVEIIRVQYEAWRFFAPFHYLTADLNKAAACYALFANNQLASFAGVLHRPHPKHKDVKGLSRLVTLPDWQGLGLAMILAEKLASAYKAIGYRFNTYPAHPSLIRSFSHSESWALRKKPGLYSPRQGKTSSLGRIGALGGRPCAVFGYAGASMELDQAKKLLAA